MADTNLTNVLGGNTAPDAPPDVLAPPPSATPAELDFLVPKIEVKPVLQDPFDVPVHEHPDFLGAVGKIWNAQTLSNTEQNFIVNSRKVDGTPVIKFQPGISSHAKEQFVIEPNTTAIVHSHPPGMDGQPSPNDISIADKNKVDMYVIGRSGLYFYKANSGKPPVLVQKGLDFLKNQTLAKTLAGK